MQDIADVLGISKVTVSKALNDKDGVGEVLKEKIQEIADQLGYQIPESEKDDLDILRNIAIVLNEKFADGEAGFYLNFYHNISTELNKKGYLSNLFTVNKSIDMKNETTFLLTQNNICGAILLGDFKRSFVTEIKSLNIPCIFVDFYDVDSEIDCIVTENIYSTYNLTNHLIDYGHRDIGFVGCIYSTTSIQDRFLGYCRALMEHKIPINNNWIINDRNEENEKIQFNLPEKMPGSFVCNCDDTAFRFIKYIMEQGYRVPDDISIVSFDNDIYAELSTPKLTTVAVDIISMAKKAADLIVEKVEEPNAGTRGVTFVKGNIIYRDSVKRVRDNI